MFARSVGTAESYTCSSRSHHLRWSYIECKGKSIKLYTSEDSWYFPRIYLYLNCTVINMTFYEKRSACSFRGYKSHGNNKHTAPTFKSAPRSLNKNIAIEIYCNFRVKITFKTRTTACNPFSKFNIYTVQ